MSDEQRQTILIIEDEIDIQEMTDRHIKKVEDSLALKEKEIMTV